MLLLAIEPEHLQHTAETAGVRPTFELPEKFRFEDGLLEQLVRTLARQFENCLQVDLLYTESLTQTLLLHLIRRHSDRPTISGTERHFASEPRIQRAVEFIQANLAYATSLARIASEADLNTSQFCNVFKNVMGLPPHQYVLKQRVERALTLLKGTTLPVSEIALRTGFADQSHLTRILRQHRGVTPRQVRR